MSSSESEEENLGQLLEAADTSLFNDAMFRGPVVYESNKLKSSSKDISAPFEFIASNRYLNEEESVFQSDLNVTESMKKFIGKKLSTLITDRIAFVDVEPIKRSLSETSGVKLLRGFEENLNASYGDGEDLSIAKPGKLTKRRIVVDCSDLSRAGMIELAACNVDVLSKSTVCWTNRPKSKLYEYREVGKSQVPTLLQNDEFSTARRKNNWDDSKIKAFCRNH